MSIHIFGIRHHGPGCARSLLSALKTLKPDIVLVEGPPDAQEVLPLLMHKEMKPPVALLIYAPDDPKRAVYYPFTYFSPEWQALHHALKRGNPARFMDLPQAIALAQEQTDDEHPQEMPPSPEANPRTGTSPRATARVAPTIHENGGEAKPYIVGAGLAPALEHAPNLGTLAPALGTDAAPALAPDPVPADANKPNIQDDPLAMLAEAAGYTDHELWWERQIEQRRDITNFFEGILEAMIALRADTQPKNEREAQREAHMRQTIRAAEKEGFKRIAVVCGAWHAPALSDLSDAKSDTDLLSGLKRIKVEATWIPWTNSRLAYRSGYGAGVTSPSWYEHLWTAPDKVTIRWMAHAAHLLRKEGLDASSASVIEAVRLSEALAAIRDLPMPGLAECHEAIETVLCNGNAEPMKLIRDRLEIGERLGEVPLETPAVPLQRDLEAKQRRLRFKPTTEIVTHDFDLRNETDRARSQLLHQLRLLNIEWGKLQSVPGTKKSTFHEIWKVQWHVEFVVSLIEKNIWGNTVEVAATAFANHQADTADDLPELTELLDKVILAELPQAVDHLLECVQTQAAVSSDVRHLMDALPPLARVARYGNVRETKTEHITPVIDGLFERIIVGLPGACSSLDDDAATAMVSSINNVQESLGILNREDQRKAWQSILRQLIDSESIHGLVRGRCCRLLLEQQVIDEEELHRLARLALSPVTPAPQATAWIEGVLQGSGYILLEMNGLWRALDTWLGELSPEDFVGLLPLLRRAFSGFQQPERRKMGEKAKHLRSISSTGKNGSTASKVAINQERADTVLPVLARILEVNFDGN